MAASFTAYFDNECIESTKISNFVFSKTGYYGDNYYSAGSLSTPLYFTATPADGCYFTRWVYRVGDISNPQQFSYDNPFIFEEEDQIYIRAEGAYDSVEPELEWTISKKNVGTISETYNRYFYMNSAYVYRHEVVFENSGTATFYTESSIDTYGYLTATTAWDDTDGTPDSYLKKNDDGGADYNFSISYEVEADTVYYLWVKGIDENEYGYVDLYIEPPEATAVRPNNFSWTYSKVQGGKFNLTATEWNNFTSRINAFRAYKGLSNYSFTYAYKGNRFTATMYNQARLAIQGISGYGTYIPTVTSGQNITAYMMNVLVSELNAIP